MTWAAVAGGGIALFCLLIAWPLLDNRRRRRNTARRREWDRRE